MCNGLAATEVDKSWIATAETTTECVRLGLSFVATRRALESQRVLTEFVAQFVCAAWRELFATCGPRVHPLLMFGEDCVDYRPRVLGIQHRDAQAAAVIGHAVSCANQLTIL